MGRRKLILLILFTFSTLMASPQQVNFIKYTMYDGLVANPVRCIYQDSKGFIWIGTFEGLSRYDGHRFINYSTSNGLSHNLVNSIIEVKEKLLIAENNGAIDVIANNAFQKGYLAGSAVNSIQPYKDRLLITTDANGFYEYKNDSVLSPQQGRTGTALGRFIELNDSLLLTDGVDDHLIIFKKDLSIFSSMKIHGIHFYSLFKDSKKRIWACTTDGLKLLQVTIHSDHSISISFSSLPSSFDLSPLNNSHVTSIIEEMDGSFWISTLKGLVRIYPAGSFHVYNEKDGLPSAMIFALFRDKESNLWIGTSLGLAKWVSRNNVVFYNTEYQDFRNDITTISLFNDNCVILSTEHGLQQFDFVTKEFKNINTIPGSYYFPVSGSSPLLVHYGDKIGRYDSEGNMIVPIQKLDTTLSGIIFARQYHDGTILLGGIDGLFLIKKSSVERIIPYRITGLTIDTDGKIWVGTWNEGLYCLTVNETGKPFYHISNVTSIISQKQIRGLYIDSKKNIWVGTRYRGAFCITINANDKMVVQQFNRQTGLMSDWVSSFAETESGDIWVGSYLGLDKLVKESVGYRVFNFSKVVNFFAEIKKIVSIGNNEWICVANTGIACFKDENIHQTPPLQATILSASLGVLEKKLTIYSPEEKIDLKPDQNAARFEFSALGFVNEKQLTYSYRLKGGNDTTWSKAENVHEASYVSLSPGHYTFEVKTFGWNGQDGTPASFSFFIATPFWNQWWFLGLCAVLIVGFFYALYRYRIRQLLRLQKVRNSIATDLHDEIGSALTNISILSELSKNFLTQPEKAKPFLERISEKVLTSSQAMDDIIWSVNSHHDSLPETLARMRRYTAELFDNSITKCHLNINEDAGNKKLTMEQRRDVYLIYKEALNNIHKHAYAANVWIQVNPKENKLNIEIKDDGKGFNTDQTTHRNGLKNLKTRVEKWKGTISIQSHKDMGTEIDITIPFKD